MIPEFNNKGHLPEGVHLCSGKKFLEHFLFSAERKKLQKSIADIFDWAKQRRATKLFIGGSFVSNKEKPNDIDCLIVFYDERSIPHKTELLTVDSTKIDIQFCPESEPKVIDTFLHLFGTSYQGDGKGIIQIDLYNEKDEWVIRHYPDESSYEIVKRAYIDRHYIDHHSSNGVLVTIPGILSNAKWNAKIAPIASSQKWIFAPFHYTPNSPDLLINKKKRENVVEQFRDWIYELNSRYKYPISVIAHSFGTYIITSYIMGFDKFLPVKLNSLIFTGSIITKDFDWNKIRGEKVGRIRNEIAPNDQWVKHMPKVKWLDKDPLFGKSGVDGFNHDSEILTETSNDIFDHNNVIKNDVIEKHWLPYLNANKDAFHYEFQKYLANGLNGNS